jgi:hypothetical protein
MNPAMGDLDHVSRWSGVYSPEMFLDKFGILPKNYEKCINVVLCNNEGDARVPLTPWMVAHRIVHAFFNANSGNHVGDDPEIYYNFMKYHRGMNSAITLIKNEKIKPMLATELYATLASFGSARNHKVTRDSEFIIDIAVQYFLKGKFEFNHDKIDAEYDTHERITKILRWAKPALDAGLAAAVGKLVVF